MDLNFNFEGIDDLLLESISYFNWFTLIAEQNDKKLGKINCIFCDDAYILKVNQDYLQHDYYTDIITFDYCEGDILSGDLFVSIDTVRSNSELYKVDFIDELNRVLIHGLLHLIGYKDHSEEDDLIMRDAENNALMYFRN